MAANPFRVYDLIIKKKRGEPLTAGEIGFLVSGFTSGEIPDFQMAAFLMAVCFQGMDERETTDLTMAMAHSGDMVDLSGLPGEAVDKHSTGGVGDKTTLVAAPVAACFGVPVAKMSGRGLGHTGGTIDKLEAVPGLRTAFTAEEFVDIVRKHGLCIAAQSGNLAPADKKLYALRDLTATVDSVPLIAASVMSKKIAAGCGCIVLDVKAGGGAFMKPLEDAVHLAKTMVSIGEGCGRKTVALVTNMDVPLGRAIGNSLEIREAVEVLSGKGPEDLADVCAELAANMLFLARKGGLDACRGMARQAMADGRALAKLADMVEAQGGDRAFIEDTGRFPRAKVTRELAAPMSGYISRMDAEACGVAAMTLGAGRERPGEQIDHAAGIMLLAKTGDYVEQGQPLAVLHAGGNEKIASAGEKLLKGFVFSDEEPERAKLVYTRIEKGDLYC